MSRQSILFNYIHKAQYCIKKYNKLVGIIIADTII